MVGFGGDAMSCVRAVSKVSTSIMKTQGAARTKSTAIKGPYFTTQIQQKALIDINVINVSIIFILEKGKIGKYISNIR